MIHSTCALPGTWIGVVCVAQRQSSSFRISGFPEQMLILPSTQISITRKMTTFTPQRLWQQAHLVSIFPFRVIDSHAEPQKSPSPKQTIQWKVCGDYNLTQEPFYSIPVPRSSKKPAVYRTRFWSQESESDATPMFHKWYFDNLKITTGRIIVQKILSERYFQ